MLADKDSAIRKIQAARKRQSKKQEGKKSKKGARKSGAVSMLCGMWGQGGTRRKEVELLPASLAA